MDQPDKATPPLGSVQSQWGKADAENFGYESDEARKSKRGLEDWELVEKIPESQKPVPYWFFAVVLVVLLVGIGLSFPFWGLRPGDNRPWLDWGFASRWPTSRWPAPSSGTWSACTPHPRRVDWTPIPRTPNPAMIADPLRSRWCGIALGLALCGCSGPVQDTATVNWRDLQVHVESRSYGPIPGMKELLVFVNRNGSLPAWDCRVELRTSDADPWKQAIEDGHVGVYRRAAKSTKGNTRCCR